MYKVYKTYKRYNATVDILIYVCACNSLPLFAIISGQSEALH